MSPQKTRRSATAWSAASAMKLALQPAVTGEEGLARTVDGYLAKRDAGRAHQMQDGLGQMLETSGE
jgi:hypothetical protein